MNPHQRIDVATAVALINERMPDWGTTTVDIADAAGGILREPLTAERDQPPFNRVTMDGIAVRYAAIDAGLKRFRVSGVQAAGADALSPGADDGCVEIMTGAMLATDLDTVIPIERLRQADDCFELEPGYHPQAGQFVHRQGSDHRAGQRLLEPGTRIGVPEMAVLTITGRTTIKIARWPRIAVISTGDELVEPGAAIAPFQIRSSNDRAIETALRTRSCSHVRRARLPDEPRALLTAISELHDSSEVLILSGGVSMGKYDYIPRIMAELGVELVFHKILQRPGLPMWFGVSAAGKPVFALPGNPVSSLVCLVRYVVPALEQGLGLAVRERPLYTLAESVSFEPDLTWFLPVSLTSKRAGQVQALPCPTNTSGDFVGLAGTDGFVELPRGRTEFPAGFPAAYYPW